MRDALPVDLRRRHTPTAAGDALIFYGVARADVESLVFRSADGSLRRVVSENRAFTSVYPSSTASARFEVEVEMADDRVVTCESEVHVPDPATVKVRLRDAEARRAAGLPPRGGSILTVRSRTNGRKHARASGTEH